MTREEAIIVLQKIKPIPCRADGKSTTHILQTIALEMAIQALSQEPCGDAISREDAIIAINKSYEECEEWRALSDLQYGKNQGLSLAITVIEDLPSVTQKSGKWISVSERLPEEYGEYLITWKNPKYPKTYIGICECEITDVCDHEHNRFEVEWLFDGYIATAYPDSKVIAWMPLPEPYKAESEE